MFGLAIMVMVYATGHLSGAHINPAVTIGFTLTRHFPAREALAYIAAQLAGAALAALLLLAIWPSQPGDLGATTPFGGPVTGASMNPARSFGPALVSGEWRAFWAYLAGPIAGATIGALAYQSIRGEHSAERTNGTR